MHLVPGEHEPTVLVGLIRVRNHCTFTWRRPESLHERRAILRDHHCEDCIGYLRNEGWFFIDERETSDVAPETRG